MSYPEKPEAQGFTLSGNGVHPGKRGRIDLQLLTKPLRLGFGFYLQDLSP